MYRTALTFDLAADSLAAERASELPLMAAVSVALIKAQVIDEFATVHRVLLSSEGDPTRGPVVAAHQLCRELEGVIDEAQRADNDILPFELHAAPYRIGLTRRLANHFAGRWRPRNPLVQPVS